LAQIIKILFEIGIEKVVVKFWLLIPNTVKHFVIPPPSKNQFFAFLEGGYYKIDFKKKFLKVREGELQIFLRYY
jgi:hypothetical protein